MQTVRELRQAAGLSQAELAVKAGVGVQTIYRIEKGKPAHILIKQSICKALNVEDVVFVVSNRVGSDKKVEKQ